MGRMQEQRYELKYWIHERTAQRLRPYLEQHLLMDEVRDAPADLSYPVHSLYLDSPGLDTYWHTINGNKEPVPDCAITTTVPGRRSSLRSSVG